MVGFGGPSVAHTTKPRKINTAANRNENSLMPWLKIDYTLKRKVIEYAGIMTNVSLNRCEKSSTGPLRASMWLGASYRLGFEGCQI